MQCNLRASRAAGDAREVPQGPRPVGVARHQEGTRPGNGPDPGGVKTEGLDQAAVIDPTQLDRAATEGHRHDTPSRRDGEPHRRRRQLGLGQGGAAVVPHAERPVGAGPHDAAAGEGQVLDRLEDVGDGPQRAVGVRIEGGDRPDLAADRGQATVPPERHPGCFLSDAEGTLQRARLGIQQAGIGLAQHAHQEPGAIGRPREVADGMPGGGQLAYDAAGRDLIAHEPRAERDRRFRTVGPQCDGRSPDVGLRSFDDRNLRRRRRLEAQQDLAGGRAMRHRPSSETTATGCRSWSRAPARRA